jgi:hypothetical protein
MPTVTMWRTDRQRCLLLVGNRQFTVQIRNGDEVLRTQVLHDADEAVSLANSWAVTAGLPDRSIAPVPAGRELRALAAPSGRLPRGSR